METIQYYAEVYKNVCVAPLWYPYFILFSSDHLKYLSDYLTKQKTERRTKEWRIKLSSVSGIFEYNKIELSFRQIWAIWSNTLSDHSNIFTLIFSSSNPSLGLPGRQLGPKKIAQNLFFHVVISLNLPKVYLV